MQYQGRSAIFLPLPSGEQHKIQPKDYVCKSPSTRNKASWKPLNSRWVKISIFFKMDFGKNNELIFSWRLWWIHDSNGIVTFCWCHSVFFLSDFLNQMFQQDYPPLHSGLGVLICCKIFPSCRNMNSLMTKISTCNLRALTIREQIEPQFLIYILSKMNFQDFNSN